MQQPNCGCAGPGYSRLCCCNQAGQPSSAGPDISLLRPELQRQWHHAKNQLLGDRQITASSGLHVWWTCDQCSCGFAHEWLAIVSNRQDRHSQCPYCTNNRLCQHNSLLTMSPAVAAYWDTAKNGVTPDQVTLAVRLEGIGSARHAHATRHNRLYRPQNGWCLRQVFRPILSCYQHQGSHTLLLDIMSFSSGY